MKNSKATGLPLAAGAVATLCLCGSAQAHHSSGQFDTGNCVNIYGTVRTLEWVYPHVWLWIMVPKEGSETGDAWGFEFPSPTQIMNLDRRWSKTAVVKGDKVMVTFSPMKDGRHGGWMHSVTIPNGNALAGAPGMCDRSQALAPEEIVMPIKAPPAAK